MTAWTKRQDKRTLAGRPWRRLREQILKRDTYLCQACLAAGRIREATEVDHVRPLARGGDDTPANLRAICARCHQDKTITDNGGRPKVAIGLDGFPVED